MRTYIASLRGRHLKRSPFRRAGGGTGGSPHHPALHQRHGRYLRRFPRRSGPGHGRVGPDRRTGQPLPARRPERGRPGGPRQDAAPPGADDRHLLPALRGHGRHQLALLPHLRHRCRPGYRLPRPLPGLADRGAAPQPRGRRGNDRRQGRSQQRAGPAGRPRPVRACGGPPARWDRHPWRQGPPDRGHQLPLAPRHARSAPRGAGERLRRRLRRPGHRPRPHLHLRAPGCRLAQPRGRPRRRQRPLRRAGGLDRFRRCLRPRRPRLPGRGGGLRRRPGGAVHRLPPPFLRLQGRGGRRAHRGRRPDRRLQRRARRLPRSRQTRRDGSPERDHVRRRDRRLPRGPPHRGRQLGTRPLAGQRVQAERDPVPLRDRPPRPGPRRRVRW